MESKNTEALVVSGQTFVPIDTIAERLHVQKRCASRLMRKNKLLIAVSGSRNQYVREDSFESWLVSLEGKC